MSYLTKNITGIITFIGVVALAILLVYVVDQRNDANNANAELRQTLSELELHIEEQETKVLGIQDQYATLSINAEKLTQANEKLLADNKTLKANNDAWTKEVTELKKTLRTLEQ